MSIRGVLSDLVLRSFSDAGIALWQIERRTEFLWRDHFDRVLVEPLFTVAQILRNARRTDQRLGIAEERLLGDEDRLTDEIIDQIRAFTRQTWPPGTAQRFGQTKTIGLVRALFTARADLPDGLRQGVFARHRTYRAWVRFSGPGPYAPPDIEDFGQCCVAIKLMGVDGPKLMDDEQATQDLTLVSPPTFLTADLRDNAVLQRHTRAGTPLMYFLDPRDPRPLTALTQFLYSRAQSSPLECRYYSTVPFLHGPGQAVQYALRPRSATRTPIPARPSPHYLREAMARTLDTRDWSFDLMVQRQTDAHQMPIEDAGVKWPERLSPYVPVATLRIPRQRFDSDEQLRFADSLRFNPWHSLAEHRPLGSQNRARRAIYLEMAKLRQAMNAVEHVEPTGDEAFPGSLGLSGSAGAETRQVAQRP